MLKFSYQKFRCPSLAMITTKKQIKIFGLNSPKANVPALAKHGCKKKVLAKRKEKK